MKSENLKHKTDCIAEKTGCAQEKSGLQISANNGNCVVRKYYEFVFITQTRL